MGRALKVLIVAAVLATVSGGVYVLFFYRAPPPVVAPLPNPNGYDDLVRAGSLVTMPRAMDPDEASIETLREHIEANREALELARVGLSRECRVPLAYTTDPAQDFAFRAREIALLGYAFEAEGQLAEREGRLTSAMRSYLDLMRLRVKASRGGLVVHGLVLDRHERSGLAGLERVTGRLGPTECRQAVETLESAEREPFETVLERDAEWSRTVYTPGERLWSRLVYGLRVRDQSWRPRLDATVARCRRLLVDLAARCYTIDKAKPPAAAADLVPEYLSSVPVDPTTGKPLTLPAGPVPEPAPAASPSRP